MVRGPTVWLAAAVALAASALALLVLRHLSYPLLWNDEADTAVMAERVLAHGVPRVTGPPSLRYHLRPERIDPSGVYRGGLWGGYYAALPGVALARGVEDLHERTARMRLPFALYGLAGLAVVLLGLLPVVGPGARRRLAFALAYLVASAGSVSLLLHLREARHYAPLTLAVSAVAVLFLRRRHAGGLAYGAGLVAGLFAVFNLFHPAFLVLLAWMVGVHAWEEGRGPGPLRARVRRLARALWPVATAAAAVLPVALALDVMALSAHWLEEGAASARGYGENLGFVARGMLRYELLAPAAAARAARLWVGGPARGAPRPARLSPPAAIGLLVVLHVAAVSAMPLVWERYVVFLSPLLTAAFLLDGFALVERWRASPRARRAGLAVAACTAVVLALRVPDVAAHVASLRVPVRGPLDYVIPHLAARYPDPSGLVIATNYEGPAYTWYLRSHVILGYYGGNREAELELVPDVIVPRRWPRNLAALLAMSRRADYVRTEFPVAAVRTNQSPSLWRGSPGGVRHAFRTPRPTGPERTFLLERVRR